MISQKHKGWHTYALVASALALCLLGATLALKMVAPGFAGEVSSGATVTESKKMRFGVVPQQSASRLAKIWGPIVEHIGKEAGIEITFVTTKNIPTFEACLQSQAFDVAYMNPYHYVIFSERAGYRAIAHQADKKLRGLMVVRKDSPIRSVDDLDGKKIAFPSPGAFGASVLPRAEMLAKGLEFEPNYVKSHDSVYRAVAAGFADAGGGVTRTFNAVPQEMRDQLRIISQTDAYTPHAVAISPKVSADIEIRLSNALLAVQDEAPDLLKALKMSGIVAATGEDWNDVRALNIRPEQAGLDSIDGIVCPFD